MGGAHWSIRFGAEWPARRDQSQQSPGLIHGCRNCWLHPKHDLSGAIWEGGAEILLFSIGVPLQLMVRLGVTL